MSKDIKIIVEQHSDGFVAYPEGMRGVIVGQGDTRDEAIADVTSAPIGRVKHALELLGFSVVREGERYRNGAGECGWDADTIDTA